MKSVRRPLSLSAIAAAPGAYWLGWLYYKRGRWAAAERKFATAVLAKPDHAPSHFQRGMVEFKRERWDKAYAHMREAISLCPDRTDWMVQFCQAARHLKGSSSKAIEICTSSLLQQISENRDCYRLRSGLAVIYRIQGRAWLELEALKDAAALRPADSSLQMRLGEVCEKMKRWPEAAGFFQRAAELAPRDSDAAYRAGVTLEMDGKPAAAAAWYEKFVAATSAGAVARFGIAARHEKAMHWKLAADAYRARLADEPQDAALHFKVGLCCDRLQNWQLAIHHYRSALALSGAQPDWNRRLGLLLEKLGDFSAASECYARLLEIPGQAENPISLYRRAWSLDQGGRYREACEVYDAVCPPKPLERFRIPRVGENSGAIAELRAQLGKDATPAARWTKLGELLAASGDWEGSVTALRQAIDRHGEHERRLHHLLGHALAQLGRYGEACAAWRNMRILQRNPGTSEDPFRRNPKFRRTASYTEYSEVLPLRGKTVLYESFHGRMLSCNPYALFLHMLEDPDYAGWTHIWALEDMAAVPERFKGMTNVIFVTRDSDVFLRHLATASILISNVSFPSFFIRRDGQIYLNTWHGTPWKTLGRDAKGEFMNHGNVARNLLQASHIASPNRHTSDVLLDSYNVDGILTAQVRETGSPRVDLTLKATAEAKGMLRKRLGIPAGRKVVLYAPTWRGILESPRHEVSATEAVISRLKAGEAHLLFRGHYFVETALGADSGCVVPADITTNELLAIVDVLVTDYSSVFFDFLPTGRPVVFYLDDHASYVADRGLYFDIDRLPGPVATEPAALATLVKDALAKGAVPENYARFREEFCSHEDGEACRRTMEFLLSETSVPPPSDGKKTILIFGGHFALNGITIALIALLRNIDYATTRVVLIVEMGGISLLSESVDYLKSLPPEVRILPRAGTANTTLEERRVLGEFNKSYELIDGSTAFEILRDHHRRELRRLFGASRFDAGIDYSGYSCFYACLFGFAGSDAVGHKAIYQHNEMFGEWKVKYPELERVFHLYRQYDKLISVSPGARNLNRDHLASEFGIPRSEFDFVENPVNEAEILLRAEEPMEPGDAEKFFPPGVTVFLTIGRLSVEKDHRKLIQAFAKIHAGRPDTRLLIIGDGPLAVALAIQAEALGLSNAINLAGYRVNPFPYLKRADCFVFSSNHEGQGLVLLEAMMLHKPIVCADIEVCRGVVDDRSGLMVDNSADGLVHGMTEFLAGHVLVRNVDFDEYRRNAMMMFHTKSCGFDSAAVSADPAQQVPIDI